MLPTLAVTTWRLHGTGKSGGWQLIVAIPFLGALVLIAFRLKDGIPISNRYGPNPKVCA